MSGPKVVRIVTREEILDICRGQLARVDAALSEWIRIGRRNDCLDEMALETASRRRDALAALIAADRFMDLQKQAPAEEEFLRADMQRRLAIVAAAQAEARSKERRVREAATALLRRLRELGVSIDPSLVSSLERGEAAALADGFELLARISQSSQSASTDLAANLKEGATKTSFADWLSSQPAPPADPAIERVAVRLDELHAMRALDTTALRMRLDQAAEIDPAHRSLIIDGLEVETGRALTEARRRGSLRAELLLVRAEMTSAGGRTPEIDLEAADAATLEAALVSARAAIGAIRAERAAAARRTAVLDGLSSLGYEVTQGMSTSLAQDGRLVLRSAARPDYGVEVSAVSGAERMQMRPVAFEAGGVGPPSGRDRDAETIWCGDVTTLQASLAASGGGLVIERAHPIGATPLKRIAVDRSAGVAVATAPDAAAPLSRERKLR